MNDAMKEELATNFTVGEQQLLAKLEKAEAKARKWQEAAEVAQQRWREGRSRTVYTSFPDGMPIEDGVRSALMSVEQTDNLFYAVERDEQAAPETKMLARWAAGLLDTAHSRLLELTRLVEA